MRFYDKKGGKHDTLLEAYLQDIYDWAEAKSAEYEQVQAFKADLEVSKRAAAQNNVEYWDEDLNAISEPGYIDAELNAGSDHTEAEENTSKPAPCKININYAHQRVELVDDEGNIIKSSPIDPELAKRTADKDLLEILYPDGNIPDDVKSNIESISKDINTGMATDVYADEFNDDGSVG